MAKRRRRTRGLPKGALDALVLGGDVAAVKRRASRKEWRRIVKAAHSRGLTVSGLLSDAPGPMKERSRSSLVKQAKSTIASAYRPALQAVDTQESRVRSLEQRRQQDASYYRDWLTAQQARIAGEQKATNDKLLAEQAASRAQLASAAQQIVPESLARLQGQTGTVSGNQIGTAIQSAAEGGGRSLAGSARRDDYLRSTVSNNERARAQNEANAHAAMAALRATQASESFERLAEVADERQRVLFQQGSDTAREIARLLEGEVGKAQSNREFGAALQKLGIDRAELQFKGQEAARDQRNKNADRQVKFAGIQLDAQELAEKIRHNKASEKNAAKKGGGKGGKARFTSLQKRDARQKLLSAMEQGRRSKLAVADGKHGVKLYNKLLRQGFPPTIARAGAMLAIYNKLDRKTKRELVRDFGIGGI